MANVAPNSVWQTHYSALPNPLDSHGSCWNLCQTRTHLAACRCNEWLDGATKPDRPDCSKPSRIQGLKRLFFIQTTTHIAKELTGY